MGVLPPHPQFSEQASWKPTSTSPGYSVSISRRRHLPHGLDILLRQPPLHPRVRHLPRQARLRHLLHEAQGAHRGLPVADVLGPELNDGHARVLGRAVVHAVAQVAEPGRRAFGVELLDARVVVRGRDHGAGDGDPVLGGGVLEGEVGRWVAGQVGEFVRVRVGEEEEVGSFALRVGEWMC